MTTTPTQNPIPSEAPPDLKFNAGKIDEFVTSSGWTYTDRFGVKRYTIEGMNYLAQQVMSSFGYVTLTGVTFTTGATLSNPNEVLFNSADNSYYKWTGSFASGGKTVPANSTPQTTGGVGPGAWLNVGDSQLRSDLASGGKASLVGYNSGTVQSALDSLNAGSTALSGKTGFDKVGRFLNIADLRTVAPTSAGQIVYCASAASASATEIHYGGGFFESFNNATTPIADDGGIVIVPATGTLAWTRINYSKIELVFWGVKPNAGTDFSSQILKAMTYVRSKKTTIYFPAGSVTSNDSLPIWSNCTILGAGRESSRFIKLTNNSWPVASGVNINALCVCLPDVYNPSGYTMDTFCMRPRISGISLEYGPLTINNKSVYGIWGHKIASGHFSDMLVLGGNYGFYGINCFLMIQEHVSYSGITGSYAGVYIANAVSGNYARSGTTCLFTQVSVSGYNFGFFLAGLDSTRLVQCDAEGLARAAGESACVAYNWLNPMNCTMDNCYTEGVDGVMLRAYNVNTVSITNTLVVTAFNITPDNIGFTQSTPLMDIESAGLGSLYVTFIGGDMRYSAIGVGNMQPPKADGGNTVIKILGAITNPWAATSGAVVTYI